MDFIESLKKYPTILGRSGLAYVIAGFSCLVVLNLATLLLDPNLVYSWLEAYPWGVALSFVIFDSWPTVFGLIGTVVIFAFVLFEVREANRHRLSIFFLVASMSVPVFAQVYWNAFYNNSGTMPAGSSGVDFGAEGAIMVVCIFGMIRLLKQQTWKFGSWSKNWCLTSTIIYLSVIGGTLVFVLLLQPIFIPSNLYNWKVHQLAFLFTCTATLAYGALTVRSQGFDGRLLLSARLMNNRFVDIGIDIFGKGKVPFYRVAFRKLGPEERMQLHPELKEIWVSQDYKGKDYNKIRDEFDSELTGQINQIVASIKAL